MAALHWLAVSVLGAPIPAAPDAATPTVAVQWRAPAGCPSVDVVQDHIARLAPVGFVASDAALDVQAVVRQEPRGFVADLALRTATESQTRELVAPDCAVLARAVGVVVAVALDPVAVAGAWTPAEPEPESIPEPEREPEPEPEPLLEPIPDPESPAASTPPRLARPADRPTPARRRDVEFGARVGVGAGGLILPRAGVGVTAAPFVGVRRFQAQLAIEYWAPRTATLPDNANAGAAFQLGSVGARGCPVFGVGRWRFPLCAGFDLGPLAGTGRGNNVANGKTAVALWTAVVLQPGVELSLTPMVDLWAAFEGAISLNRPRYHLEDGGQQQVHQAGAFGPRGFVGVVLHAPRSIP